MVGEMAWVKNVKRRLKNGVSKRIQRGKATFPTYTKTESCLSTSISTTRDTLPHSIMISEADPRIKKKISFSEPAAEISRKSENFTYSTNS